MRSSLQSPGLVGRDAAPSQVNFHLEPGERILWQGRPRTGALRRHLFKVRWLAVYVAALLCWKLALILWIRGWQPQEAADVATLVAQGVALLGIVAFYAWALARTTTYTLTNLRIVIRHGIALPGTVDIPLRALRSVAVRVRQDGTGDVALGVREGGGIGFAKLWPHVQGLGLSHPVPMLRGLADAAVLSTILSRRLSQLHDVGVAPEPAAAAPRAA